MGRRSWPVAVAVLVSVVLSAACSQPPDTAPLRLVVAPVTSRVDQQVVLRAEGIAEGGQARLTVSSTDAAGVAWSGSGTVTVKSDGTLMLSKAAPSTVMATTGAGASVPTGPTGLIPRMRPAESTAKPDLLYQFGAKAAGFTSTVQTADGRRAQSRSVRQLAPTGLREVRLTLAQNKLVGTYLAVPDGRRHPAALVLGGSEGGEPTLVAAALAARGIPSLAQAYFQAPGLPTALRLIPLETFDAGLAWLKAQPEVDPNRIWVIGASRGSEAALLVASRRPGLVHGVVGGLTVQQGQWRQPPDGRSAWTEAGRPIPFTRQFGDPSPTDTPGAVIPVEKINGPVIAVCGGSDTLWPSCPYGAAIMKRLDGAKDPHRHEVLEYPRAGHWIDLLVPYVPVNPDLFLYGLSPV